MTARQDRHARCRQALKALADQASIDRAAVGFVQQRLYVALQESDHNRQLAQTLIGELRIWARYEDVYGNPERVPATVRTILKQQIDVEAKT